VKKLIIGVFILQIIILAYLGIPAGGAANAVWRDAQTGLVVRQDNPTHTIESYRNLVKHESYDAAVLLFEPAVQKSINGDLLRASEEFTGQNKAELVKVISSNVIGDYAVAAMIQILESAPEQPVISLLTLRQAEGKWEIVQDMYNADLNEIQQVFERAIEVCQAIMKEPFANLTETQRANLMMQAGIGSQYIEANLQQLNEMMRSTK
jgi:hypothetical protein